MSSSISIIDYIQMRKLDVLGDDTDLDNHQFVITDISWRLNRDGEIMESQQVNVKYENSFVLTTEFLDVIKSHRWNGHRQVEKIRKFTLSDGYIYEIFWKTFRMKLPQLLPPNGYAYELVAQFLLQEQERLDAEMDDTSESSDSGTDIEAGPGHAVGDVDPED